MDYNDLQKVDRNSRQRAMFYVDLVMFAILAISIVLITRHSYWGGRHYTAGDFYSNVDMLWLVVADTAFLVASLMYLMYRYFRSQYIIATRRL